MQAWAKKQKGFTIVELLIVIIVVAILAAISIVAYNGIQQRARDTQRKSDLATMAKALEVRAIDYDHNLRYTSSDCAAGSSVSGFLSQTGTALNGTVYGSKSAAQCLKEESKTSGGFIDPSGATSCAANNASNCFVYMFCSNNGDTYIFAHLESLPYSTEATDTTCQAGYDSSWGMNYYVKASAY